MNRRSIRRQTGRAACAMMLGLLVAGLPGGAAPAGANGLNAALQGELAEIGGGGIRVGRASERLTALRDFYADGRDAIWTDGTQVSDRARAALDLLGGAAREGLTPDDYLPSLPGVPATGFADPRAAARFELVLSDVMLRFLADLRTGRVSPGDLDPDLEVAHAGIDRAAALAAMADAGPDGLRALAASHAPANPVYRNLRTSLAAYRRLAALGGWPEVAGGETLHPGDSGPRVATLRRRLAASADLLEGEESPDPALFDATLQRAVERFQRRHGLDPDGVVGKRTQAALDVPVEARIRQIALNMERWRWMPDDLGRRHVFVNIAGFELNAVEDGTIRKAMRVVVGKLYRRTPVFSGEMSYLEINPFWHVPPKIAAKDLLPKIKADPAYLAQEGFSVFDGWDAGAARLDPASIDWARVSGQRFPYKLRQDPGPKNALGRIKFMFPNEHDVYLHDSPARELFRRTVRTFSSGCIRVERPLDLAEFVLDGQPGWDRAAVEAAMAEGETRIVTLAQKLPVHLTYLTAWTGEDGTIQFREDVYERDRTLDAALTRDR